MPVKKRFISWAAVSSKPQAEKVSLEEQQLTNKRHIEQHDGHLVTELVIPGESRDIVLFEEAARRMEAYMLLKEAIDTKAFDVLIFLNLGRLGRDVALIMAVVRLCQRAGIALYATEAPPPNLEPSDNYTSNLILAFQAVGYQNEISQLKTHNRDGMIERIKQGNFPAKVPWPWIQKFREDGAAYLEISQDGAMALHLIAEAYLERGLGTTAITEMLNEAGHTNPSGGAWTRVTVSYVIRHAKRYAGITEYHRRSEAEIIEAPSRWPAIWSEATAVAILKEKRDRAGRSRVRSPHRFSRCVYCSICGQKMRAMAFSVPARRNYQYRGFRCDNRNPRHKLANIQERFIVDVLRYELEQLSLMPDLAAVLPQEVDRSADITAQLGEAQGRLQSLQEEVERADMAFTRGLMSLDRYQSQVERITKSVTAVKATIGELQASLDSIEPAEIKVMRLEEFVREGSAMLTHEDVRLANAFFRNHIEIWVSHGKVDSLRFI